MTCKDSCLCFDVCSKYGGKLFKSIAEDHSCDKCPNLKDKSRFIELPCNVGDTVYYINFEKSVIEAKIYQVRIYEDKHIAFSAKRERGRVLFGQSDIGKIIFLSKEEAEARLKELNQ